MSEFLQVKTDFSNDIKIIKMMSDYGALGVGYYFIVLSELQNNGGVLELDDLYIIEKKFDIKHKNLRNFVLNCIEKYTTNEENLFSKKGNIISLSKTNKTIKTNIRNAGRKKIEEPKPFVNTFLDMPEVKYTRLTEKDVEILKIKFGEKLTFASIQYLDNWLATNSANAKKARNSLDHYGYFRIDGWVIAGGKEILEKRAKENKYNFGI